MAAGRPHRIFTFVRFCWRLNRRPLWADLCRSGPMLEGKCPAQSCRSRCPNRARRRATAREAKPDLPGTSSTAEVRPTATSTDAVSDVRFTTSHRTSQTRSCLSGVGQGSRPMADILSEIFEACSPVPPAAAEYVNTLGRPLSVRGKSRNPCGASFFSRSIRSPLTASREPTSETVFRLFVSSPGDVAVERAHLEAVVEKLNAEFKDRVASTQCPPWETNFYSADETFQKQIPETADCDLKCRLSQRRR